MLTAAVAASNADSAGYLRACLQQTGLVQSVSEWAISTEQYPAPGESVPDVVVLELGVSADACFAFAAHLRRLRPSVCTMVCSAKQPHPDMLIEAMRHGVREFLGQPVDPQVLQGAIERLIQERGSGDGQPEEKLLVVMGAKGGVGTTTVALNLASSIALQKKSVIVVELRAHGGTFAPLLNHAPISDLSSLLELPVETLRQAEIGPHLVDFPWGLKVLFAPGRSRNALRWMGKERKSCWKS